MLREGQCVLRGSASPSPLRGGWPVGPGGVVAAVLGIDSASSLSPRTPPASFASLSPRPPLKGEVSADAPVHRHARFSPSGHCQRSGSGAHGRAFLMFSTWRDFRAPLGVCPEVGRSQRPLHVHSMDKTPRLLRMVLGSGICAVLVPRRPVSGPRVPGYHTRAGGHRHSPLIPVPDPVPQERWGDYGGSVWGGDKSGVKKCVG
jgi:hypothetical protein